MGHNRPAAMTTTLLSQRILVQSMEKGNEARFYGALRDHLAMARELEFALNDALNQSTPPLLCSPY